MPRRALRCFGIFVIETKNFGGGIDASKRSRKWTATYHPRSTHPFLNPVHQNAGHVRAVENLLKLPLGRCHNVVFLAGAGELKNGPLAGVVEGKLAKYIEGFQTPLIEAAGCADLGRCLRDSSCSRDPLACRAHRAQWRSKFP